MAQFDSFVVRYHYRNNKSIYYSYDDELYASTFPEEWSENHLDGSGPKDCDNCAFYGSWNGVFIGYCCNCAREYNYTRGHGFISCGEENIIADPEYGTSIGYSESTSAFGTYLKGVNLRDVGDIEFNNTMKHIVEQVSADIGINCNIIDEIGDYIKKDPRDVLVKICDAYSLLFNKNKKEKEKEKENEDEFVNVDITYDDRTPSKPQEEYNLI